MKQLHTIRYLLLLAVVLTTSLFAFILLYRDSLSEDSFRMYSEDGNHPGRAIFSNNCMVCHSIEDTIIGPPLNQITNLKSDVWTRQMIRNGHKLIQEGDTYAVKQYEAFGRVMHPDFEYLSQKEIGQLIEYLKLEANKNQMSNAGH